MNSFIGKYLVLLNKTSVLHTRATILFTFLFAFFFILIDFNYSQSKIGWKEISPGLNESQLRFIHAESVNDFWMDDLRGSLFHFRNSHWQRFNFPLKENYREFRVFNLPENSFLIFAINKKDYSTDIAIFNGSKFTIEGQISMPAKGFVEAFGRQFIYGDWGSFYERKDESLKKIITPIKNHIFDTFYDKDFGIFLGTRGEGIFLFDGRSFKKIQTEDSKKIDIIKISKNKSKIIASTIDNSILLFNGKSFNFLSGYELTVPKVKSKFGFKTVQIESNKKIVEYFIPVEQNLTSYIYSKDNNLIYSTSMGKIFHSYNQKNNFFNLFKHTFKVEGHDDENSTGAAFINLNDDLLPEIFVLNENGSHNLFLNQKNNSFADISINLSGIVNNSIQNFAFGDINNDSKTDLLFLGKEKSTYSMLCSNSERNLKFNFPQKIIDNIPGDNINFRLYDFDKDGKTDFIINQYLNNFKRRGKLIRYKNNILNKNLALDKTLDNLTSSWNTQTVIADFNNDDIDDYFITEKWRKSIFLLSDNKKAGNKYRTKFFSWDSSSTFGALAFDYNNDGQMDLLVSTENSLLILLENKNGTFKNVTDEKLNLLNEVNLSQIVRLDVNVGDLNNDGFQDILINLETEQQKRNFALMNMKANYFVDFSDSMKIFSPYAAGSIIGDIDNDGDLDIYGFKTGSNYLWLNNLDNLNYLKISIRGIISDNFALGTKVWIYTETNSNGKPKLIGYKQLGSDLYGINNFNDLTAHFGVAHGNLYSLKVKFPSGKIIFKHNVYAGQTLIIEELSGIQKTFYLLPAQLFRLIIQKEIQFYTLTVIFALMTIFFGIKYGIKKYQWPFRIYFPLATINISLFWLILILTIESEKLMKFLLAPSVLFIGILIPNLIFLYIKNQSNSEVNQESLKESLFNHLIHFTHGEWALRNLNSLQVFFQNVNSIEKENTEVISQLENRKETFLNLTSPSLSKIADLSLKINSLNKISNELKDHFENILSVFNNYSVQEIIANVRFSIGLAENINLLKQLLTETKKAVFADFSCDVIDVVQGVANELQSLLDENKIKLLKVKNLPTNSRVLIKNFELADIIDNSIRNSVKALENCSSKEIQIKIYNKAPKILIEIIDNGIGIHPQKFEKIFEYGYSEFSGTGKGLSIARKVLEKYGGRIYLKNSESNISTQFIIELNQGY